MTTLRKAPRLLMSNETRETMELIGIHGGIVNNSALRAGWMLDEQDFPRAIYHLKAAQHHAERALKRISAEIERLEMEHAL